MINQFPDPQDLINRYPPISDQMTKAELLVICKELISCLSAGINGDIVEFGCYVGTTALYLQRILQSGGERRELHLYDSFAGLPEKSQTDNSPAGEQFAAGALHTSKAVLLKNFYKAGLPKPHVHTGWFSEFGSSDIPRSIAFAFLDGDFYDSIIDSWRLIKPRLGHGATVIIDDYGNIGLPGARRAAELIAREWSAEIREIQSLAVLRSRR